MTNPVFEDGSPLPPPTAPKNISVSIKNFQSDEHAERFAHVIANTVYTISRLIDLERLDGITVAYNYDDALVQLDRGYQPSRPPSRTSDGHNVGVAMSPAVLRAGVVKAHLLFLAPVVLPLEDLAHKDYQQALYIVAHECAHVEDFKNRDVCFPGTILQRQITDQEEAILERFAGALWDEYAACRASAIFGEAQTAIREEIFAKALPGARERANAAIRSYRYHGNIDRVLEEAGSTLCEPLRFAAYLIGHVDGRNASLDDVPRARDLLSGSSYEPFVNRLRDVLRGLWLRRGRWTSLSEFKPLREIARDLLADGGIILQPRNDGTLYVNIPFRQETMP